MKLDFVAMNDRLINGNQKKSAPFVNGSLDQAARSFADYMKAQVDHVADAQAHSKSMVKKFAMGQAENVHEVILAGEKSSLAMKTMNTMRKKLLEAYKDIAGTRL